MIPVGTEQFAIVPVRKGGHSLRCLKRNETFHPVIGPETEARILHVDQQRIVERARAAEKFVLWDVGLGAAANALTAINALMAETSNVEIHSFDISIDPLHFALDHSAELTYIAPFAETVRKLLATGFVEVRPGLRWYFHGGDFCSTMLDPVLPLPHSIFYDPYSATGNMEMWNLEHFTKFRERLGSEVPFLMTNYTRSTAIRCTLLLAGFFVGVGCKIGDKGQTTIVSNKLEMLDQPLPKDWLTVAWTSRNGAPLRGSAYNVTPILEGDFKLLEKHPQFVF
jgi:hypothetical protein